MANHGNVGGSAGEIRKGPRETVTLAYKEPGGWTTYYMVYVDGPHQYGLVRRPLKKHTLAVWSRP